MKKKNRSVTLDGTFYGYRSITLTAYRKNTGCLGDLETKELATKNNIIKHREKVGNAQAAVTLIKNNFHKATDCIVGGKLKHISWGTRPQCLLPVLWIRIRMFLGLPDDRIGIRYYFDHHARKGKKNLDFYCFITSL
jgi:hypothetical protein